MNADELQLRTKEFAIRVIRLVQALPNNVVGWEIGKQVLRSSLSVGANYRAARRARSKKEFIAKIGIVLEEADETEYWLEIISDVELIPSNRVADLRKEAAELMKIFAATKKTAKLNKGDR